MTDLLTTYQVLEGIAQEEIKPERLGSLIYWEINKGIKRPYADIVKVFAGTRLQKYIESVDFVEAIRRFAEKVIYLHGNTYGKVLKFQIQNSKAQKGITFASFYTGELDKKTTDFTEHCKYIFINSEEDEPINILSNDSKWLLNKVESSDIFLNECFLIINKDIQAALSTLSNNLGYRFNSHGGHYFVAHRYTNDLYKIKAVLGQIGQTLSIMPIIVCNDMESEEVIRIIGNDLKNELDECQKELFELCIPIYNFQVDWRLFCKSALENDIEGLGKSRISKIKYGSKLYKQILSYSQNSGIQEYKELVTKLLKGITPNENKSARKLFKISERLDAAVKKLRECSEDSVILGKYRQKVLADIIVVGKSIQKVSELILDEALELKF